MSADLPPSSSCSFLMFTVDASMMRRPVSVDPVNAMRSTSGWAASAWPASLPEPGDDVDDPRRHTGLVQDLGHPQHRQRGVLGRLQHGGAPAGQDRTDDPELAVERTIPRDDPADDPDRRLQASWWRRRRGCRSISVSPRDVGRLAGEERQHLHQGRPCCCAAARSGRPCPCASIWMSSSNRSSRTAAMRVSRRLALVGAPPAPLADERLAGSAHRDGRRRRDRRRPGAPRLRRSRD